MQRISFRYLDICAVSISVRGSVISWAYTGLRCRVRSVYLRLAASPRRRFVEAVGPTLWLLMAARYSEYLTIWKARWTLPKAIYYFVCTASTVRSARC
jgi:hypothetical protein